MTFIKTTAPHKASGKLKTLYDRVKGPDGHVDNIMTAHSLRPASLEGHMVLYKNVLHHSANQTPKWILEMIGVYVSLLNECSYCVMHHFEGLRSLLGDDDKASAIKNALTSALNTGKVSSSVLSTREIAALDYAAMLTKTPGAIRNNHIAALRTAGWDDGEILEINQVTAYFAYANRTVLGLGVSTDGDTLGLSPNNNDDENDWGHQ
ncbi:MAG: peroxidase-related enzyme [Alphaproteobacteria bacterium]|nr:peroxidase-related enzyme [Alphaproteobacteria bacterium]